MHDNDTPTIELPIPSSPDAVAQVFHGARQERDSVRYPVRRSGEAGTDHARPDPRKPVVTRTSREEINPDKTFFVSKGVDEGGIRQNWSRWRLMRSPTDAVTAVEVVYAEYRDAQGRVIMSDKVTLTTADAYNFLKLVGDRNFEAFAKEPASRPSSFQA